MEPELSPAVRRRIRRLMIVLTVVISIAAVVSVIQVLMNPEPAANWFRAVWFSAIAIFGAVGLLRKPKRDNPRDSS
jgi:hypothetical protein